MASTTPKESKTEAPLEEFLSGAPATEGRREGPQFPGDLPEQLRTLLVRTPPQQWPFLRGFFIESEEAAELVDLIPAVNQAMRYCPSRLTGRASRREITTAQIDRAYRELHDALSGIRHALLSLYALARLPERQLSRGLAIPARVSSREASRDSSGPRTGKDVLPS